METSNPALILLEVSENGSHFLFKNTDQEELSGWQSFEKPMVISPCFVQKQGRKSIVDNVGEKEQSFSSFGNVNKGLGSPDRRFVLGSSLYTSKSREGLHVKFEHFSCSSQFIEQYRRAKEVRFQAVLTKLMEHRCVKSSGHIVEKKTKSVSGPEQRQDKVKERSNQEFVNSVTPSLPQTGCFTGKKWVFPKEMRSVNHNCGSKCGSKLQVNKPGIIQVHNVRNMFLKGTGKPINTTCKKTWTVPKQRSVNCKSAPVRSSRRSHEKIHSQNNFTQTNCMTSPSQSEPTNCIRVSSLIDDHQGDSLLPKRTHQSFEQLKKTWKSVGCMARRETTAVNNNIHSVKIC